MTHNKKITTFTHSELNKFVKDVSHKNLTVYLAASIEEWGLTKEDIEKWLDRLGRYMDAVNDHLKWSGAEEGEGHEIDRR